MINTQCNRQVNLPEELLALYEKYEDKPIELATIVGLSIGLSTDLTLTENLNDGVTWITCCKRPIHNSLKQVFIGKPFFYELALSQAKSVIDYRCSNIKDYVLLYLVSLVKDFEWGNEFILNLPILTKEKVYDLAMKYNLPNTKVIDEYLTLYKEFNEYVQTGHCRMNDEARMQFIETLYKDLVPVVCLSVFKETRLPDLTMSCATDWLTL